MVRQHLLAALGVIFIASCTSETRSLVVADDACVSYGYHVGTPQYRLCGEREAKVPGSGRELAGPGPVR
jgi:hypothetical protein